MITLHIENKINDYAAWKEAFERYDRARSEHQVLAYRISRPADDPSVVYIDLDFGSRAEATGFIQVLEKIWQSPLSQAVSPSHSAPELRELLEQQTQG